MDSDRLIREMRLKAELGDDSVETNETASESQADQGRATRYEIQELVGTGAAGEVYKAFDTVLKRTVALKFLRKDTRSRPTLSVPTSSWMSMRIV